MNCYSAIFLAVMHIPYGEVGFIGFVQQMQKPYGLWGRGIEQQMCRFSGLWIVLFC